MKNYKVCRSSRRLPCWLRSCFLLLLEWSWPSTGIASVSMICCLTWARLHESLLTSKQPRKRETRFCTKGADSIVLRISRTFQLIMMTRKLSMTMMNRLTGATQIIWMIPLFKMTRQSVLVSSWILPTTLWATTRQWCISFATLAKTTTIMGAMKIAKRSNISTISWSLFSKSSRSPSQWDFACPSSASLRTLTSSSLLSQRQSTLPYHLCSQM